MVDLASPSRWFWRRSLFGKYAATFVSLVIAVLVISGVTEAWFTYHERKAEFLHALSQKADGAAQRVEEFLAAIERQTAWASRTGAASLQQRRADFALVLQQTPQIAEMAWLDESGKERLRVKQGNIALESGRERTRSVEPQSVVAPDLRAGSVTFTDQGPRLELSLGPAGSDRGSTIADVDLKSLSDIVNGIQADPGISAYIVTPASRLIAHTNPALAKANPDLTKLPQIAALADAAPSPDGIGRNLDGDTVLTAAAHIPRMNWWLFVEAPQSVAMGPFYDFLGRLAAVLLLAFILCILAGLLLARHMTIPIMAVGAGAARLANGDFSQKINVETGDEIEALADEFNRMAGQVQDSYARLEQKVADRTRDLAKSVRELKALEEVGRALAASLDLKDVLATILSRAVELAGADGGAIYRFYSQRSAFTLAEAHGLDPNFVAAIQEIRIKTSNLLSEVALSGMPIEVPQIAHAPNFPLRGATLRAGFQSALIVPLIGSGELYGALVVERQRSGHFPADTISLMKTFADHAVLAMRNAQLFHEVEERGRQLALANEHKSLFFANMSHELRTPLNAVLGYSELLRDGLYGELPERAKGVLERVEANGRHLLGLINDVLDIAKIEAGELTLSLADYSLRNVVETVVAATGSLAAAKGLSVATEIAPDLPTGRGDERRLTQVLLNIVSNAIKFTDTGGITLRVDGADGKFAIAIKDTGPGIAPADQARIFEAFQQVDNTITKEKGGTGLGLSISKRFVEMHGGTISVSSTLGQGSTFHIRLPVRVDRQSEAA
ncbi:MAG: ATP-binding protein [Beijerinckiaceae bacterium]